MRNLPELFCEYFLDLDPDSYARLIEKLETTMLGESSSGMIFDAYISRDRKNIEKATEFSNRYDYYYRAELIIKDLDMPFNFENNLYIHTNINERNI